MEKNQYKFKLYCKELIFPLFIFITFYTISIIIFLMHFSNLNDIFLFVREIINIRYHKTKKWKEDIIFLIIFVIANFILGIYFFINYKNIEKI